MKHYFLLLITLMAAICSSCDKDDESKGEASFAFETPEGNNPTLMLIKGDSYSNQFAISANGTWRIEKPQTATWISVSEVYGQGNGKTVISATPNTLPNSRRALITFYLNDKKYHAVTIKQNPEKYFIEVEPATPENIPAPGGDIVLDVNTNTGNWEYKVKGDNTKWLSEKTKNANSVTFTAAKSTLYTEQTATIEFTTPDFPELSQVVTIKQDPQQPPYLTIEPETPQNIPGKGGDITLTLNTNIDDWTCTIKGENSEWLTEKSKDATSITFTAGKNKLNSVISAIVEFTAPDYPEIKQAVTLKQDQKETPFMAIEPGTPDAISAQGGTVKLAVNTNADGWTYKIEGANSKWLTEETSDATSVTFKAAANSFTTDQKATVTFTSPDEPGLMQQVEITQNKLAADLLDVVFGLDGTATDASPMKNKVEYIAGTGLTLYYNASYERYVAKFDHPVKPASVSSGFYKVSYADNQKFQDALANGHTLETVMMYNSTLQDRGSAEVKWFSSHESGGTGFLLERDNSGDIAFIPNMSGTWQWTRSGVVPEKGVYYHVAAVLDLQKMQSSIYVDGVLKATVNVKGTFKFPSSKAAYWFGIGGDASTDNQAQAGWNGDIAIARVYDSPLTSEQIANLYKAVHIK